jgi:hypothetical protein
MDRISNSLIKLLLMLLFINNGSSVAECRKSSCGPNQPHIRFPFQLVKGSQDRCSYPEFCLHCTENNKTMLFLPSTSGPIKFFVDDISYEPQFMSISDPDNCLPKMFLDLKLNRSSFLPYQFFSSERPIAFFDCSSVRKRHLRNLVMPLQERQDIIACPIYASVSFQSVLQLDLVSCTKIFEANTSINGIGMTHYQIYLSWSKPNCTVCEIKGMKCRWSNNGTKGDIECFDHKRNTIHIPKFLIFSAIGNIVEIISISNYFFCIFIYIWQEKSKQLICRFNYIGAGHRCNYKDLYALQGKKRRSG